MTFAGLAGCIQLNQPEPVVPRTWGTGATMRVEPDATPPDKTPVFDKSENVIRLGGLRNETVAFNYVVSADAQAAVGLRISLDELISPHGTISRDRVRLYRYWPVSVARYPNWYLRAVGPREPAEFPDILVPIDAPRHGEPFTITRGQNMSIWIEIRVPQDAPAELFESQVVVRDETGAVVRTPVELSIRNGRLGSDLALPALVPVRLGPILKAVPSVDSDNIPLALSDESARRAVRRTFEILHEHGLCPYSEEIKPDLHQEQDGSVTIDWGLYDEVCKPLIDGSAYADGAESRHWPLPVDLSQPNPARYDGVNSGRYGIVLRQYLSSVHDHFRERGWLDRAFVDFHLPVSENPEPSELDTLKRLAALTHSVDRNLAFLSRIMPQSMVPFGWTDQHWEDVHEFVDIWATPARYNHAPTLKQQRALGKLTWLSPDRPPFSGSLAVEAPWAQSRSLPWQAFLQEHDALLLSGATDWPPRALDKPLDDRDADMDTWLLYPGEPFGLDEPVPSVRLKQLQQGLQDYQYLRRLDELGHGETARLIAGSLIKACGAEAYGDNYQDGLFGRRVDDEAIWHLARRLLSEELAAASAAEEDKAAAADQAEWRSLLRQTRGIEMWGESARLLVDARPGQTGYLLDFGVGIRNELRTPVTGSLTFGPLPLEWRSVSDLIRIGPLNEMQFVRNRLIAAAPQLPRCDLDGHFIQAIRFDAGASGAIDRGVQLSVVQTRPLERPITVDGSLRDWPPSDLNVAGDFRILRHDVGGIRRRPRASSQTVVYFANDTERLYIGIHAARPPKASVETSDSPRKRTQFGNVVRYQDLMPVGEDLVEIVLDPSNTATQPDDIYHIVVKASGQAVFERGVRTEPPIGRNEPWLAGDQWMIETSPDGWSAELAIPLSAFPSRAAESRVWGVNMARLEPLRGEYSDWAGAVRYCYDPRTMGNLVWAE